MAVQKQDDQHEHTLSRYVRIRDVVLKTCLGRWTIGRSGERGSGISVLPARHDDDFNASTNDILCRPKSLQYQWYLKSSYFTLPKFLNSFYIIKSVPQCLSLSLSHTQRVWVRGYTSQMEANIFDKFYRKISNLKNILIICNNFQLQVFYRHFL